MRILLLVSRIRTHAKARGPLLLPLKRRRLADCKYYEFYGMHLVPRHRAFNHAYDLMCIEVFQDQLGSSQDQ